MTSTQLHPLFAAFAAAGNANALSSGNASSSSSPAGLAGLSTTTPSSGSNHLHHHLTSPHQSPTNGLFGAFGSGLSVTITPAAGNNNGNNNSNHNSDPNSSPERNNASPPNSRPSSACGSSNNNANAAVAALAMALSNAKQESSNNRPVSRDNDMDTSSPPMSPIPPMGSPPMSRSPTPSQQIKEFKESKGMKQHRIPLSLPMALAGIGAQFTSSGANNMALAAQQQQLRALAATLQNAIAAAAQQQQQQQQQQNNSNLIGKMIELANANAGNPPPPAPPPVPIISDDQLAMSELTQRLIKMNQEIWQQGLASVAAAAASSSNAANASSNPSPPPPSQSTNSSSSHNSSGGGVGSGSSGQNRERERENEIPPGAVAAVAALNALTAGQQQQQVNEIKLAEKLVNELAVQIFMHKSAMQLQQQQAVAAQQQVQGGHHLGPHGPLMRAGSSSGSESGAISKPHQCQQCLKSFSSNHQLVQHIRVHTGEKPYKCSYCDRRFKQLSHVQQHTRLHTGERPYKCHIQECGRAFIQLSNLQQHLRNHDAQLERSKNRPFHCNTCGKGFATESSLRTHTSKQHGGGGGGGGSTLIGSSNALSCPVCHKLFLGGEALMEHMKYTHKDPNASGVATKRRTANHPCPICGKHYVNEGSLRKHLSCHPETAQLSSSLRMWPCSVCQAVFTHENGLLTHMEQMRMDPKHQFAAQYVLSRAAAERRERENILAAAAISAMAGGHPFAPNHQGQGLQHGPLGPLLPMPPSPSGSESSGRLSSPLDTNSSAMSHTGMPQHTRISMVSPGSNNGPLELTRGHPNGNTPNNNNATEGGRNKQDYNNSSMGGQENNLGGGRGGEDQSHHHSHSHPHSHLAGHHGSIGSGHHNILGGENGVLQPNNKQLQDAMKMAAMLGPGGGQNDIRNLIHQQDMMTAESMRMESLLRSQAEALRLAVENHSSNNNNNHSSKGGNSSPLGSSGTPNGPSNGDTFSMISQHQQSGHHGGGGGLGNGHRSMMDHHRMDTGGPGLSGHHHLPHPHSALNHQSHHHLNSILSQQPDLSEALMRLDARSLGFPLPAHNS